MDIAETNLRWASTLVETLAESGVCHAVLSPGSRSTPLTLACARFAGLKTWVLPDERSAAFFALGLARSTGSPPMVVSTSGTAPANWYPALIEASQALQSLLLVSADRPAELQGCGANQTIDQTRLFGAHVRAFMQLPEPSQDDDALRRLRGMIASAVDQCQWPTSGPVHINIPFHEPLVPLDLPPTQPSAIPIAVHRGMPSPPQTVVEELARLYSGKPGMIVCGRGDFEEAFALEVTRLAERLACPVLADPLSGLRFGPHDRSRLLTAYDAFLRQETFTTAHRPAWILRFGAAPISKSLQGYLDADTETDTTLVVPQGPWPDPGRSARRVIHADPTQLCTALADATEPGLSDDWWSRFRKADAQARDLLQNDTHAPLDLTSLLFIGRHCPAGTAIFCGNSLVIRDVETAMHGGPQRLRLIGNRGASGIDGNVSTALGVAAGWPGPVVGLLGDLALYHDMNGLLAARGLDPTLVVFNNGGGAIFDHLPQRRLPEYERYWLTPTGLDIARMAALYELRHARVAEQDAFEAAFEEALPRPGADLIEVVVEREHSLNWHRDYWTRVASGTLRP